jgi:hypothetical protein
MKQSLLKTLTITISLAFYIYSFTFEAFSYNQGIHTMSSLDAFNGSIAVLGGGTHEWLIWLANPLCFTAIYV